VLCDGVAIRFHVLPPVQRPHHQQDRPEAQERVEDDQRHPHADAKAEQDALRGLAGEGVEQQRLLGADPGGADREEHRKALRHLDEDRVVQRRRHVEGAQEEEDRDEPETPVRHLPDGDMAQVVSLVREDAEAQRDVFPEPDQVLGEPEQEQQQRQEDQADCDQRPLQVREEPVEVERVEVGEHGATWQLPARERVEDEARREDRVEQCQRNERRAECRVGRALDPALGDEQPDCVAAAGGHDCVDADAGEVGAEDRAPADGLFRVRGGKDVPPGAAGAAELRQLAEEGDPQRRPADIGQVVEEDTDVV